MTQERYWFSCTKFTYLVVVEDEAITKDSAPIVRTFYGQPLVNLIRWATGKGWRPEYELMGP